MEQTTQSPCVDLAASTIKELYEAYTARAIICRFNGLWPNSEQLHQWIHQTWSTHVEITLCAKGLFIVYFECLADFKQMNENGPWFWGSARCFITPWKSNFDPVNASVTITPVWVRLLNLPIHFWCIEALKEIGNTLGKFVVVDEDRLQKGMATYVRICVEVDLSKGFPEKIILQWYSNSWEQYLEYENTAFRCISCLQTRHLQGMCLLDRTTKKRNPKPRSKRWDNPKLNNNSEIEVEDDGIV